MPLILPERPAPGRAALPEPSPTSREREARGGAHVTGGSLASLETVVAGARDHGRVVRAELDGRNQELEPTFLGRALHEFAQTRVRHDASAQDDRLNATLLGRADR